MLDELPLVTLLEQDGTIDEDLFPSFAALADDSHWFRHTTSVSSTTMYAVPSMLSGILPTDDASAIAADHPDNLFTWLGDGYDARRHRVGHAACAPPRVCEPPDVDGGGPVRPCSRTRPMPCERGRPLHHRGTSPPASSSRWRQPEDDGTDFERILEDSARRTTRRASQPCSTDSKSIDPDEGVAHLRPRPAAPRPVPVHGRRHLVRRVRTQPRQVPRGVARQPEYAELATSGTCSRRMYADALARRPARAAARPRPVRRRDPRGGRRPRHRLHPGEDLAGDVQRRRYRSTW